MKAYRTNIFVKIAVVVVIVFFITSAVNLRSQLDSLISQKEALQEQIDELGNEIEKISIRLETPLTVENIEKIARETLGYRDPDEFYFRDFIEDEYEDDYDETEY